MSRTPITDTDLGHLVPQDATAHLVDGPDAATVTEVYNPDGTVMTVSKSLRMPASLATRAENAGHPDGFSGVVREAVSEWLDRHGGAPARAEDARAALAVLARVVGDLERHAA